MRDSAARGHISSRIEELSRAGEELDERIAEWEGLTEQHTLSDVEFDLMRQLLVNFRSSIDEMSIEQKRAAVRSLVRKVVWDGEYAHVVLFGASDDEIEYPEGIFPASDEGETDDSEELAEFLDVDYEEDDGLGKTEPLSAAKARWGADSK